jgi:hypothetical protein
MAQARSVVVPDRSVLLVREANYAKSTTLPATARTGLGVPIALERPRRHDDGLVDRDPERRSRLPPGSAARAVGSDVKRRISTAWAVTSAAWLSAHYLSRRGSSNTLAGPRC